MGFKWVQAVYDAFGVETADINKEEMSILVALAFRMNDHTCECFPSVNTLSEMTHISRTTIFARLKTLCEKKFLAYRSGGFNNGKQYANQYKIVLPPEYLKKMQEPQEDDFTPPSADSVNTLSTPFAPRTTPVRGAHYPSSSYAPPPVRGANPNENNKNKYKNNLTRSPVPFFESPVILGSSVPKSPMDKPQCLIGKFMSFCKTSLQDDGITFSKQLLRVGPKQGEELLERLKKQQRKGELKGINNMPAFVTSELLKLPNENPDNV